MSTTHNTVLGWCPLLPAHSHYPGLPAQFIIDIGWERMSAFVVAQRHTALRGHAFPSVFCTKTVENRVCWSGKLPASRCLKMAKHNCTMTELRPAPPGDCRGAGEPHCFAVSLVY